MRQPTNDSTGRRVLRGTELRGRARGRSAGSAVPARNELIAGLAYWGFAVDGRPSKTVSDALRWERRRGRVMRRGRGLYSAGEMPRSTEHRIISRVLELRKEAGSLSLAAAHWDLASEE